MVCKPAKRIEGVCFFSLHSSLNVHALGWFGQFDLFSGMEEPTNDRLMPRASGPLVAVDSASHDTCVVY
jgi:hypothetical protein